MTVNSNIAVNISDQDPMELLTVHKPIAPLSIHNRAGFPHTCRPRIDCLPSSCLFVRNEFTPSSFSLWSSLGGRSPTCRGLRLPHHHCSTNAVGGSFARTIDWFCHCMACWEKMNTFWLCLIQQETVTLFLTILLIVLGWRDLAHGGPANEILDGFNP